MISAYLSYQQINSKPTDLLLDDFDFEVIPVSTSSVAILPIKTSKFLHRPGITAISTTTSLRVSLRDQVPKVFVLVSSLFEVLDEGTDLARDDRVGRKTTPIKPSKLGDSDISEYLGDQSRSGQTKR